MSAETIEIRVAGAPLEVRAGQGLAAALMELRLATPERVDASWTPLCAMGSCHGCRVRIDGGAPVRACLERCRAGMEVEFDGR